MEETQKAALAETEGSAGDYTPKTALWPEIGIAAHLAVLAVIGAIIMVAFANTLHNTGFALDNKFIILEDPRLRDNKPDNLKQIFQQDYWWPKAVSGLYRPLTTFSYMINYKVFNNKDNATGYHWMNLLIHWANALLVYFAILVLMEKQWPAVFGAIIFAVHPIVTESVTNMVGRADLLATFTVLLGFILYAKSCTVQEEREIKWPAVLAMTAGMFLLMGFCLISRNHANWLPANFQRQFWVVVAMLGSAFCAIIVGALTAGVRSAFWLCLMMLVTAIGVFCKESAVVVIGVMLLFDFTYRLRKRSSNWISSLARNFWDFSWKGYIALVPPIFALWYVRSWVFEQLRPPELPFVDNPLIGTDFWTARITAIKVIGKYFWLLIWPQTLSCDYSYNQIPFVSWSFSSWEDLKALIALATIITLIVVAIRSYFRNKAVFFFILFFFGTLLPTSNCFPKLGESLFQKESWCIGSIMAERFLYMPSIGFAGCLVIAVYAVCRRIIPELDISAWATRIWLQIVARCTLALLALGFGVRTVIRNPDWEDDVVLWTQAAQACPDSFKSHKSLAYALYEKDQEQGFKNIDRIIDEGEKALGITDKTQIVFLHLGAYYRIKGDMLANKTADGTLIPSDKSLPWYQKSAATLARAVPLDHEFNDDNRKKEVKRGRKENDIADIGNHEIYWNLGLSYMRLGNYDEALKAYKYMRHLSPTNPDSYLSIASVYITTGKNEDAAITLLQALLLDSNRQEALRLLVEIYRQIDKDGYAVITLPNRAPQLNADSALVKLHICRAYDGLTQIFTDAKQFTLAQQTRKNAQDNYKCAPEPAAPAANVEAK